MYVCCCEFRVFLALRYSRLTVAGYWPYCWHSVVSALTRTGAAFCRCCSFGVYSRFRVFFAQVQRSKDVFMWGCVYNAGKCSATPFQGCLFAQLSGEVTVLPCQPAWLRRRVIGPTMVWSLIFKAYAYTTNIGCCCCWCVVCVCA